MDQISRAFVPATYICYLCLYETAASWQIINWENSISTRLNFWNLFYAMNFQ